MPVKYITRHGLVRYDRRPARQIKHLHLLGAGSKLLNTGRLNPSPRDPKCSVTSVTQDTHTPRDNATETSLFPEINESSPQLTVCRLRLGPKSLSHVGVPLSPAPDSTKIVNHVDVTLPACSQTKLSARERNRISDVKSSQTGAEENDTDPERYDDVRRDDDNMRLSGSGNCSTFAANTDCAIPPVELRVSTKEDCAVSKLSKEKEIIISRPSVLVPFKKCFPSSPRTKQTSTSWPEPAQRWAAQPACASEATCFDRIKRWLNDCRMASKKGGYSPDALNEWRTPLPLITE